MNLGPAPLILAIDAMLARHLVGKPGLPAPPAGMGDLFARINSTAVLPDGVVLLLGLIRATLAAVPDESRAEEYRGLLAEIAGMVEEFRGTTGDERS